ncbi:MAG: hypothetical protein ACR2O6_02000 [Ilumatobacteraceae bacterium]
MRRLLNAAGRVDLDEREDRIRQASTQGADVTFLFGASRDDLSGHDGVAAELYWVT